MPVLTHEVCKTIGNPCSAQFRWFCTIHQLNIGIADILMIIDLVLGLRGKYKFVGQLYAFAMVLRTPGYYCKLCDKDCKFTKQLFITRSSVRCVFDVNYELACSVCRVSRSS